MPRSDGGKEAGARARDGVLAGALIALVLGAVSLLPAVLGRTLPSRLDLVDFFWPMKAYTAARWRAGGIPLWNPLSGCGEPWLAQLQTGVLYPPDLVFLLPWPAAAWAAILLHLAIAGAGMAAWLRDLGASRSACVIGAGLFAGSGAFLSLVPVLNNAWTAAWLPWIFLAARWAATGGSGAGLALASALAFLGGEPTLAGAGTAAAIAVALFSRGEDRASRGRPYVASAAGLLLAAGLACAVAWPFGELVQRSGRLHTVSREEALARPVRAGELGDLVAPPRDEATRALSPSRGGYLVSLAGTPLLFLLAAGAGAGFPGRRRFLVALAVTGALGLAASLGAPGGLVPLLHHLHLLPGARFPARAFVFAHLTLCVAAAAGWDGWLHGRTPDPESPDAPRERRAARLAALIAVAVLAGSALCALATAADRDPAGTAVAGAATLAGALLLLVIRRRGFSTPLGVAFGAVVLAPLPFLARGPLDGTDARALAGPPPFAGALHGGRTFSAGSDPGLLRAFTEPEGRWDPSVPLRSRAILAGYANLDIGVPSATSASPIRDERATRLLGASLAGGNPDALFALADVRHLLTPFPARVAGARLVGVWRGVRLYDLPPGEGRFFFPREGRVASDAETFAALRSASFVPDETAYVADSPVPLPPARPRRGFAVGSVLADAPERTELATTCSEPGLLVVTRTFDAGWRAEVDGLPTPVLRADLAFLALPLPAGEHRVVLSYEPRSWRIGRVVSAISLLALLALWIGAPRREAA